VVSIAACKRRVVSGRARQHPGGPVCALGEVKEGAEEALRGSNLSLLCLANAQLANEALFP
jgi:hypothetical protein